MRKNKKVRLNDREINLILLFVVLTLMVINIIILINTISSSDKEEINDTVEISENKNSLEKDDKTLPEQNRIQKYAINFIKWIDDEEFSKAYKVLNDEYKSKYFPTIEQFEKYVKEKIGTGELTINFTNIERLGNEKTGNIYVLWANIYDITKKNDKTKDDYINIVILEHDYNNYELSFSIK